MTSPTALALALKILAQKDRAGEVPTLPVGAMTDVSFTLAFSAKGVKVAPAQSYTGTVAVPMTRVVGALATQAESLFDTLVSTIASVCGEAKAEEVLARVMGGAATPQEAAKAFVAAASARAGDESTQASLEAAGKVWAETFKGKVGTLTRNGATNITGGSVTVVE